MTAPATQSDPTLAIVSYALAPSPGGPEAQINAALARRLVNDWGGPLLFLSGGGAATDSSGAELAATHSNVETWAATSEAAPTARGRLLQHLTRSSQARRLSMGRLVSRALYEGSGYSIKYHAFEHGAAELLQKKLDHDPDLVIWSRVLPVVSIAAARRALLRHEARPHARNQKRHRWIVNFNDPCPPHIYPGLYPLDARTEAKLARTVQSMLPRIDAATFPSRRLYELHLEAFPELARIPARIIPHAQDDLRVAPEPSDGDERGERERNTPLLAFAGTLRQDHLGSAFKEALGRLAQRQPATGLRFQFLLTSPSRALEALSRDTPFPIDVVDMSRTPGEIDNRLAAADALMCFETEIDRPLLLTKIAGYLRFGLPILAFCADDGTTDELMARSPRHRSVAFDDPAAIADALASVRVHEPGGQSNDELDRRFDGAAVADQLRALLEDLAAARRGLCGPNWP